MSRASFVLSFLTALLLAQPVGAQLDSSSVLLRPSGRTTNPKNLDSSRYKVRAPESKPGPAPVRREERDEDGIEEKAGTAIPTPVPPLKTQKTVSQEPPLPAPVVAPVVVQPPALSEISLEPSKERPPVSEQVKHLILGGDEEAIAEYRQQIHPEDPRANVLDISLAPAYYYNGSQSGYSYRRYTSNGPGFGLGMNLWLTPFFGVQSRFFSTVSGSQRSGGPNVVPSEVQTFEVGVRFRKHFGYSRKAPHLNWGIDFHDSHNKISSESLTSIGRKSSGLSLAVEAVIPTSPTYAHSFQIDIRPRLKHSERATGVDVSSGTKNESNAVALSVGGQWNLDRRNQVFWKSQFSAERNLFEGEASASDPHNGMTPDGVSVTNTMAIFFFGFKWGS